MPKYMVIIHTNEERTWTKFFDDYWSAEEYARTGEMVLNAQTEIYQRVSSWYECIR